MNEDKTLLKIGLAILAVLAVLGALWRVLSYQQNTLTSANKTSPSSAYSQQKREEKATQTLSDIKEQELLEELVPSAQTTSNTGGKTQSPLYSTQQPFVPYPQNRASAKQTYPSSMSTGLPYATSASYGTQSSASTSNARATSYNSSGYVGPQVDLNSASQMRMQEERARMLAPYLRPNKQEKARMDAQWNKLAAALERAVAKALMPKSKKEEMLAKYAPQSGPKGVPQMPGFTGELSSVGEQLAMQKQSVMQSMGKAFGGGAAQQAGSIMDSFAGEVAQALNAPGGSAEQKAQQVKQISQKYQDKMDKLAEKNQYDKFVAQRTAEMNQEKEALRSQYQEPELNQKFNQIYDQYWQKEQELMVNSRNMSPEEYYQQVSLANYEKHHQLEDAVRKAGQSLEGLHKLEEEQAQKALEDLKNKEEQGQVISIERTIDKARKEGIDAGLRKEQADMLDDLTKVYGEESKADFEAILKEYQQKVLQSADEKLSPSQHQDKVRKLAQEYNRQLIDLRIEKTRALNIPEEQKQAIIEKLRQDYNSIQ